eukprot:TRINITY_DN18365_c0_g1_i2.p1 TRINITY_DN18365_c0_g1~~TRINITY_DN18365_c0_g1_i2.p1  ORF type:complete len:738 (-),score=73.13 TRINITY_DN18365_c0_g1_i2:27-2240(-)
MMSSGIRFLFMITVCRRILCVVEHSHGSQGRLVSCEQSVPSSDGSASCAHDDDEESLLQKSHLRAASRTTSVESKHLSLLVAAQKTNATMLPVPPAKSDPITRDQCNALIAIAGKKRDLSDAKQLLSFMCNDASHRDHLTNLIGGCLYLPTNHHLDQLYEVIEHPNPWNFFYVIENSFFARHSGEKCASRAHGQSSTSISGDATVTSCQKQDGFVAADGSSCITTQLIDCTSGSVDTRVCVFELDGLMGLPEAWESWYGFKDDVKSEGHQRPGRHAQLSPHAAKTAASTRRTSTEESGVRSVTIPIQYYVCDPGDNSVAGVVTDAMLADQTDVLNHGYGGTDVCSGFTAYDPAYADSRIQFTQLTTTSVTDADCNNCQDTISSLVQKYVKREDGKIKILLCSTGYLGFAYFPGTSDDIRSLVVNPGALPGGAITNYNLGDTLVHEMGHYLGLYHTFQDGCSSPGDSVADTNYEQSSFFGCPSSGNWRHTCNDGDPVHNFMDYSDDRCMCTFTPDQNVRMWDQMQTYDTDLYDLSVLVPVAPTSQPTPAPTLAPTPPTPQPTPVPTPSPTPVPTSSPTEVCFKDNVEFKPYVRRRVWTAAAGAEECLGICSSDSNCFYFSYQAKKGRCYMSESSAKERKKKGSVAGMSSCAMPPTPAPTLNCYESNVAYSPYQRRRVFQYMDLVGDCVQACKDLGNCEYFSFKSGGRSRCYLSLTSDNAKKRKRRGYVSGSGECAIQN